MQLIDPNHPFYRPLWVRVAIVAVCAGWTLVEIYAGEPFWAMLVGAVAVYSAYALLLTFKPAPPEPEKVAGSEEGAEGDDTGR
ncbi:hypothetical protein MRS76_02200 [Rhizobiaceae bacterium n13]|uniref:DUF3329 domain-containing protein n=1 Tax=Ferirhizobium litorale TaxID=2927786 RepID=A0AAE3QBF7_9HYPH|nr:hypothetical protein [Fererhizobium litorale]MDI7860755.1 hypothetical protein [Fererhizobium litorale]MDI7920903.1 hypothetical protein [Fererhizobium litorale]